MPGLFAIIAVAVLLCGASSLWVLRAYRGSERTAPKAAPALIMCAVTAIAALSAYLAIGRPALAGAPYSERLEALQDRDPLSLNADEALAILRHRARAAPRDPLPHFFSGQVLLGSGRAEEAARAFDAALRRDPDMTDAMLGLGRALVEIEQGRVSPEALSLFERVGAETSEPAPWIYQATAAMQTGREDDATRLWGEALARMASDDPRREMAAQMSQGARR